MMTKKYRTPFIRRKHPAPRNEESLKRLQRMGPGNAPSERNAGHLARTSTVEKPCHRSLDSGNPKEIHHPLKGIVK